MTFIIHGTTKDGTEDSIAVHGETLEEIQKEAQREIGKRGWTDYWSEEDK